MAYTDNENGDCILSNKVFHELGMHSLFNGPKYKALGFSIGIHIMFLVLTLANLYKSDIDPSMFQLRKGGSISSFQLNLSTGLGEKKIPFRGPIPQVKEPKPQTMKSPISKIASVTPVWLWNKNWKTIVFTGSL